MSSSASILRRGLGVVGALVGVERQFHVLEGGDLDRDPAAERHRDRIDGIDREGIGRGKPQRSVRGAVGIKAGLVQERQREFRRQGRTPAHAVERCARQNLGLGHEIGKFAGRHARCAEQTLAPRRRRRGVRPGRLQVFGGQHADVNQHFSKCPMVHDSAQPGDLDSTRLLLYR